MLDKLSELSDEKLKLTLKDEEVRKELMLDFNHNTFVWLVYTLNDKLPYLIDEDIIPLLISNDRCIEKYEAIIKSNNIYANKFLSCDKNLEMIFRNIAKFKLILINLDKEFAKSYYEYMVTNNLDRIYIKYLSFEDQISLLKNKEILNDFKTNADITKTLDLLPVTTINYLLNDKEVMNIFLNYDIKIVNDLIKKGLELPVFLQDNKILIDKFINIKSLYLHHLNVENLRYNNNFLYENIKENRIEVFSKDIENKSKEEIIELISVIHFEEFVTNLIYNIANILSFVEKTNATFIDYKRLEIYNKLLNFKLLEKQELIDIYNSLFKEKNNVSKFYDDYRKCYDSSTNLLKDQTYNCANNIVSKQVDNVAVYELDGEKFNILLTHTVYSKDDILASVRWDNILNTISCSVISDKHLGVYDNPDKYVMLGFNNFNPNNIIHMCITDSYTQKLNSSNFVIDFYTPNDFVNKTFRYNEILIKQDSDIYPDYVVCYDRIGIGDIQASKNLNIPIVLIHTDKYKKSNGVKIPPSDRYNSSDLYDVIERVEKRR